MNNNTGSILKPLFGNLLEQGLKLKDILIYVTIRSFYSKSDKLCYPTYEEISDKCGYSIKEIKGSIKRLESVEFLKMRKVGNPWGKNVYVFENHITCQKLSDDIFQADELSPNEKSCLLLLAEYTPDNLLTVGIKQIAESCGLSYRSLNKIYKSLVTKGYVAEHVYFNDDLNVYLPFIVLSTDWMDWFENEDCYCKLAS